MRQLAQQALLQRTAAAPSSTHNIVTEAITGEPKVHGSPDAEEGAPNEPIGHINNTCQQWQ